MGTLGVWELQPAEVLGGAGPYRVHLVPVRHHPNSASPAAHWGNQGPLVCGGVEHFS